MSTQAEGKMAADERIRVGLVGCGGIAPLYTDIYAQLVDVAQIVAVADLKPELAEKRAQVLRDAYAAQAYQARVQAAETRSEADRVGLLQRLAAADAARQTPIRVYRSHDELLKDDAVQAMVLLTPPAVRAEPAIAAAESGRHVFTQGPLARSVAEADAISAAVRRAGVKVVAQCGARYPRDMVLARRAVESGRLGQMGSARVELNWYRPQSYYRGWHGAWEGEGGGAAFHHGRYSVDPFLWVVGAPVVEVFAYAGPMLRQIEHESLSQAVLRFANGATGMLHASLLNHRQPLTPEGRIEILGYDASMLVGEEYFPNPGPRLTAASYWEAQTSFGSSDNPAAVAALEALRAEVEPVPTRASEAYQSRLWLAAIRDDTEPLVPVEVARHHVEVVRALYKSAAEHQPVSLPLDKADPFYSFEGRLTAQGA
ncbi:MAG: Gfo/Idh/MocA family oxidoreductase [Anaerolineae bacterium]|nr:Gfo/Idh/MocA family oxidoreductase [Anaerolineae bacterium]